MDEANHQYQYAGTSPDSLPFSHGKLACLGRFYAAAQIKLILASVLLNCDVQFPNGQSMRFENIFFFGGGGVLLRTEHRKFFSRRGKIYRMSQDFDKEADMLN